MFTLHSCFFFFLGVQRDREREITTCNFIWRVPNERIMKGVEEGARRNSCIVQKCAIGRRGMIWTKTKIKPRKHPFPMSDNCANGDWEGKKQIKGNILTGPDGVNKAEVPTSLWERSNGEEDVRSTTNTLIPRVRSFFEGRRQSSFDPLSHPPDIFFCISLLFKCPPSSSSPSPWAWKQSKKDVERICTTIKMRNEPR